MTGGMLSPDLATRLREAGLPWTPRVGDRFLVPGRDLDDEVFLVSDMVVEVHQLPGGPLLRFNGTTEWALDSVEQTDAVWLPREDQLRELLGEAFVSLAAVPGGFVVTVTEGGAEARHLDVSAADALARALLALRAS